MSSPLAGRSIPDRQKLDAKRFVVLYKELGSVKAVARAVKEDGIGWGATHRAYVRALSEGLMSPLPLGTKTIEHMGKVVKGQVEVKPIVIEGNLRSKRARPLVLDYDRKGVARFLFTSAQNNTPLNDRVWDSLMLFGKTVGAKMHVSQFAYVKRGLGALGDKNTWINNERPPSVGEFWFDPRIVKYASNELVEVAPGLVWCGDENIMPTDGSPLSGLQVVTGRASAIIPHPKIAMESVASAKSEPTKFLYTTGAITQKNYIARKAGKKAEFHHCYGALLVEVNKDGDWWCRQINAETDGTIYDKDPKGNKCLRIKDGKVTTGHRAEGISWGDSHEEQMDPVVKEVQHGVGGVIDVLQPRHQFFHDSLDFFRRNHHEMKDFYSMLERYVTKRECVKTELLNNGTFLKWAGRPWCINVDVDSNHNRAIGRWLVEQDGRRDPVNMKFWQELGAAVSATVHETGDRGSPYITAMKLVCGEAALKSVRFLREDESYIICPEHGGGIECGMHGDRGANGSRGSIKQFARFGRKANIGHSHSAGIFDGIFQSGCSCLMYPAYVHGPSSWSHSFTVTYPNGKRAIYTIWHGKAWA